MTLWKRKKEEPQPQPVEPKTITLSATDDAYQRAIKIWRLLGIVNDSTGAIPQMAYYLRVYQDLDAAAAILEAGAKP